MGIILTSTAIVHPWDIHPVVQPTAKVCVKNPGGAIRRKDTTGIGSVDSGRLVDVSGSVAQLLPIRQWRMPRDSKATRLVLQANCPVLRR
jgi:hypothetical protein